MTQARSRVSCGKYSALHRGTLCVLVVPAVVAAHRMCCLSLVALRGRAGSGLCPASRRDATRLQLGFPRGTHSRGHRCSDCVGHHPWARHRSSRPRIGGIGPRRRAAVTAGFGIGTCEQFVGQWACSLSPSGTQPPYMMSPLLLRTGGGGGPEAGCAAAGLALLPDGQAPGTVRSAAASSSFPPSCLCLLRDRPR